MPESSGEKFNRFMEEENFNKANREKALEQINDFFNRGGNSKYLNKIKLQIENYDELSKEAQRTLDGTLEDENYVNSIILDQKINRKKRPPS